MSGDSQVRVWMPLVMWRIGTSCLGTPGQRLCHMLRETCRAGLRRR